jgi:hypothetical protein
VTLYICTELQIFNPSGYAVKMCDGQTQTFYVDNIPLIYAELIIGLFWMKNVISTWVKKLRCYTVKNEKETSKNRADYMKLF